MEKSLGLNSSSFKAQRDFKLLENDWYHLNEMVENLVPPSEFFHGLSFSLLGAGISVLTAQIIFHVSNLQSQNINDFALGFGYAMGVFLMLLFVPTYYIYRIRRSSFIATKEHIQNLLNRAEANLYWDTGVDETANASDVGKLKEKAFDNFKSNSKLK